MTKISELHRRWSKDADYIEAYDDLGEEFDLARALIKARTDAEPSQAQLARRMKTSQSYIARIEGGKVRPSADALGRFAESERTQEQPHANSATAIVGPISFAAIPSGQCGLPASLDATWPATR
jgi:ribosome-binding protein aMBF1 (putative translation factor)